MRLDRFTIKAQEALEGAQRLAQERAHQQVGPVHLLHALISQPEGIVRPVLQRLGAAPQAILADLEQALEKLPQVRGAAAREVYLSNELSETLQAEYPGQFPGSQLRTLQRRLRQ